MELLVAVALIAVLIAILIPVVHQAIRQAHRTSCANNLKQTFVALHAYAFDRNGRLPGFSATDHSSFGPLYTALNKLVNNEYLKSPDVLFCPADNFRRPLRDTTTGWAPNPEQNNGQFHFHSYFYFYHRVGTLPKTNLPDDKARNKTTDNPNLVILSCQWKYGPFDNFHKGGGINILRLGGVVQWIPAKDVEQNNGASGVGLYYKLDNYPQ